MFLTELLSTRKNLLAAWILSLLISFVCDSIAFAQNTTNFPTIGRVEQFDPQLEELIAKEAVIQVLCGGFEWSEGPEPHEDHYRLTASIIVCLPITLLRFPPIGVDGLVVNIFH
jgi:hypothetical protein